MQEPTASKPIGEITIVKSTGERESFDPTKLCASLMRSGATEEMCNAVSSHIEAELHDGMSTKEIYKHAFFLLKKHSKPAAARYSLRRAVMDLGPSGFPFEKFVAEIFRAKGYEALTDQIVQGNCVEHEVDVVAWNENKLIMAEAKFHNSLGLKSDVKVALYIKSRFDDLRGRKFNYGRERELDEAWLVTNTKFSKRALDYGRCQNIKMIGWNYPEKGNFQDMIDDAGLHPLTSLTTLSNKEKSLLLTQGIVLAKTLYGDLSFLSTMGFSSKKITEVTEELKNLLK